MAGASSEVKISSYLVVWPTTGQVILKKKGTLLMVMGHFLWLDSVQLTKDSASRSMTADESWTEVQQNEDEWPTIGKSGEMFPSVFYKEKLHLWTENLWPERWNQQWWRCIKYPRIDRLHEEDFIFRSVLWYDTHCWTKQNKDPLAQKRCSTKSLDKMLRCKQELSSTRMIHLLKLGAWRVNQ